MPQAIHLATLAYRRSKNQADADAGEWSFQAPPLIDSRYWVADGGTVRAMTAPEQTAKDAADALAERDAARAEATELATRVDGMATELRALIATCNRRDNYLTNRVIELQAALLAVQSSGGNAGTRLDGMPTAYLPTATRDRPAAIQAYLEDVAAGEGDL